MRRAGHRVAHVQACGTDRGTPGQDRFDWPGFVRGTRGGRLRRCRVHRVIHERQRRHRPRGVDLATACGLPGSAGRRRPRVPAADVRGADGGREAWPPCVSSSSSPADRRIRPGSTSSAPAPVCSPGASTACRTSWSRSSSRDGSPTCRRQTSPPSSSSRTAGRRTRCSRATVCRCSTRLAGAGVGLGFMHYAVEVPVGRGAAELTAWIGGCYKDGVSCNPIWEARSSTRYLDTRSRAGWPVRDDRRVVSPHRLRGPSFGDPDGDAVARVSRRSWSRRRRTRSVEDPTSGLRDHTHTSWPRPVDPRSSCGRSSDRTAGADLA